MNGASEVGAGSSHGPERLTTRRDKTKFCWMRKDIVDYEEINRWVREGGITSPNRNAEQKNHTRVHWPLGQLHHCGVDGWHTRIEYTTDRDDTGE